MILLTFGVEGLVSVIINIVPLAKRAALAGIGTETGGRVAADADGTGVNRGRGVKG